MATLGLMGPPTPCSRQVFCCGKWLCFLRAFVKMRRAIFHSLLHCRHVRHLKNAVLSRSMCAAIPFVCKASPFLGILDCLGGETAANSQVLQAKKFCCAKMAPASVSATPDEARVGRMLSHATEPLSTSVLPSRSGRSTFTLKTFE